MLGPIFFNIFINDLLSVNENVVAFADDTVFLVDGDNWKQAQKIANKVLKSACDWFRENLLSINFDKSSFITFALSCDMIPSNISLMVRDNDNNVNNIKQG